MRLEGVQLHLEVAEVPESDRLQGGEGGGGEEEGEGRRGGGGEGRRGGGEGSVYTLLYPHSKPCVAELSN